MVRALPRVSLLLALAAVAWLLVLPLDGQFRNTYILENALMPGQVTSYFRESEWNFVRGYRREVAKWDFESAANYNPVLESWLQDLGLSVSHHLDAHHPDSSTMYAVMHAPRGDNTEAMVLAVPYFTADGSRNVGAFALAPALARYFARMSIWQKNIIVVFPRDAHTALRRWVDAYHTRLDDTAGSIEAALVLEYASDSDNFHHMAVAYDGLNGQLPNLDLLNTVTTVAYNERIPVSIQRQRPNSDSDPSSYSSRLRTLVSGVLGLASAGVTRQAPGCDAFAGWQIQALTVSAVGVGGPDITQLGRIVDLTFRAVNNLLEKFHQSFFFYLMLAPRHFVSIGTYLPGAVLMAASYAVSSLYCVASALLPQEHLFHLPAVLALFTAIELACLVACLGASFLVVSSTHPDSAAGLLAAAGAAVVALAAAAVTLPRSAARTRLLAPQSRLLVAFSLYFVAMLLTSLLIVHFALALTIGVCALPLTFVPLLVAQPLLPRVRFRTGLCLGLSSPLTALALFAYFHNESVVAMAHGLLVAWPEMQCWTWFAVALGWMPAWTAVAAACVFGVFQEEKQKAE